MATVRVQREDFDAGAEAAALARGRADVGAVVSFVGYCRDEGGTLAALELEHYPGMAEAEIARAAARGRGALAAPRRDGRSTASAGSTPGEQIVLVAVASAHRGEAFAAAEMLMDYLKTRAPFWKRARPARRRRRGLGRGQERGRRVGGALERRRT